MHATTMSCPVCGAPPKWAGPIPLPASHQPAGDGALFLFTWLCGHQGLRPLTDVEVRRLRAMEAGHPARECGAGDRDQPYAYRGPTSDDPVPFGPREYARLLLLRGRAQDGAFAEDGYAGLPAPVAG